MKNKILIYGLIIGSLCIAITYWVLSRELENKVGEKIDELNGVAVYYNGYIATVIGRNKTADGYNIGLKYQCVEFVKRYYFEYLGHRMPDSYGHAYDFFNIHLKNGEVNIRRDLVQFINGNGDKPQADDIIVFAPTTFNPYGHIAIVSRVDYNAIEIVQQNPGPFSSSRERFYLVFENNKFRVENNRVLGWLRKKIIPKTLFQNDNGFRTGWLRTVHHD